MFGVILFSALTSLALSNPITNSYLPPLSANQPAGIFAAKQADFSAQSSPSSGPTKFIPILKFANDNEGEGTYSYNYESANTITAQEQGDVRGDGTKAHGSYSFILPNGEHVSVTYTADQNGFVAEGSHIPTPPPVPEAILRALEENAAAEARGIFDDGQYHGEGLEESQYRDETGGHQQQSVDSVSIVSAKIQNGNEGYRY
ncbi:endocuticle structural glycoprotein SgAbd-2-like [Anthonomus grandis grandis]|uniref:endocuticle structural glycoprotein SgAbd-2-like n=1 Tax=Anthonomus grandis grandis TaxID=2921223 RepID=UPI002166074E|nr:endocuticle structural glycoprotein SgAbd-2-like [Anthonomus grandis grandis]